MTYGVRTYRASLGARMLVPMANAFEGKVVMVTGANSGIGEASAVAFQAAGAKVFGIARRSDALESAKKKHPRISWVLADVADVAQARNAIEKIVGEAGRLDVVVNNAGVFALGTLEQSSPEEIVRRQFEVNVFGPTFVTQAALPALKKSRGSVVNIGSAAGHKAVAGGSIYAATKAAIESLTRSWALELAPDGVRVNALAPGPTETPVFEKTGAPAEMIPAIKKAFLEKVPLGRMGTAEEVARWVVLLGDPSVTWLTGQVLSVDGGMSII